MNRSRKAKVIEVRVLITQKKIEYWKGDKPTGKKEKHGQQSSPLPPARGNTMSTCSCMNTWDGGDGLGREQPGSKHDAPGLELSRKTF